MSYRVYHTSIIRVFVIHFSRFLDLDYDLPQQNYKYSNIENELPLPLLLLTVLP